MFDFIVLLIIVFEVEPFYAARPLPDLLCARVCVCARARMCVPAAALMKHTVPSWALFCLPSWSRWVLHRCETIDLLQNRLS